MNPSEIAEEALAFAAAFSAEKAERAKSEHPRRVAQILCALNMDGAAVAAGALHEMSFSESEKAALAGRFGAETPALLEGLARISRLTMNCNTRQQADSVRKMIFALIDDIRVIMVKLADKLDRMRNLKGVEPEKRRKTAAEAISIWAPIANRLGMSSVKDELEDLSLKFSNPDVFAQIKRIVALKKTERAEYLEKAIGQIKAEAAKNGIQIEVNGRAKHFYSIYQKMRKRNKNADELYDLLAVRILCGTPMECYTVVGLVHTLWKPLEGRFKDYIAKPKENGYQSLHTTVMCSGQPLEIQIRTHEMHEKAERGLASHWLYKKGTNQDSVDASSLEVVNKMGSLAKSVAGGSGGGAAGSGSAASETYNEFFAAIKRELLGKSVFVFTPKGDVVELPSGACAIDFAYAIHSAVGAHITGAKADGKIIPLSAPLQNTQTIEVITSPSAHPTVNQLKQVKTPKARAKIHAWLNENDATFAQGAQAHQAKLAEAAEPLARERNKPKKEPPAPADGRKLSARIKIGDTSNFLFSFAGCCSPQYGDDVVGYVSRGRGIIVHREDCRNVWRIPQIEERMLPLEWAAGKPED